MVMRLCTHAARCSAPLSIHWDAQQRMISWQILQRVAMLLHQALHEGLAIVLLTRNSISSHALSGVLVQAGLVPPAQPSLLT